MRKQILSEEVLDGVRDRLGAATPTESGEVDQTPPAPVVGETFHSSLEDAATMILSILTPSVRDYVFELAEITLKIPRWQIVLGSIMSQFQSGSLPAVSIDPAWRQVEATMGKSTCKLDSCNKPFTASRYGQVYCSTACGDIARKMEIDKRNKQRDDFQRKENEANKRARI